MLIVWADPDALADRTIAAFERVLEGEERRRAARFARAEDRRAFVAAHGTLRFALARVGARAPADWRFTRDAGGRPGTACADAPEFSLTHTRGLVACAVRVRGAVGIDAEEIAETEPDEGLLALTCTPDEIARLRSLPAAERPAEFARLWTRKEAALKAVGDAAAFRPNVPLAPETVRALTWTTFYPSPVHVVSIACPLGAGEPRIEAVTDDWVTFGPTSRDA